MLVMGVFASLTLPDPVGVVVDDEGRPAFFFAAFSARRFCFDADGAMMDADFTQNFVESVGALITYRWLCYRDNLSKSWLKSRKMPEAGINVEVQ